MRINGSSFSQIKIVLKVPKSTLSLWVRDIPRPKHLYYTNRKEWLGKIQKYAIEANKKKRQLVLARIIEQAIKEAELADIFSFSSQRIILAFLYWAEGSKSQGVSFANTDPRLVLLFVTLLRKSFPIDESKFRVLLYLHYYHRENEMKKFWSTLLNIPESQFIKVYRKKRSRLKRYRKNFAGICFIRYNSVNLRESIMQYAYALAERLIGKIEPPVIHAKSIGLIKNRV